DFSGSGDHRALHSFPTRRSSDLVLAAEAWAAAGSARVEAATSAAAVPPGDGERIRMNRWWRLFRHRWMDRRDSFRAVPDDMAERSEEHTSELQSRENLVCRLLLE